MPTALIVGASRGIGLEFARQYAGDGWQVLASARDPAGCARLAALGAAPISLDVTADGAPRTLALALGAWAAGRVEAKPVGKELNSCPLSSGDSPAIAREAGAKWDFSPPVAADGFLRPELLSTAPLDLAIYVAGVMDTAGASDAPSQAAFDAVMHANVWGAMRLIPTVAPHVVAAGGTCAFLSSGMGLIGETGGSGSWLYRTSKAALNMAVAAARHDYPGAAFVLLDPGWVCTDMGGPGAPLSVERSVHDLRQVLARVTPTDSGAFFNRHGRRAATW